MTFVASQLPGRPLGHGEQGWSLGWTQCPVYLNVVCETTFPRPILGAAKADGRRGEIPWRAPEGQNTDCPLLSYPTLGPGRWSLSRTVPGWVAGLGWADGGRLPRIWSRDSSLGFRSTRWGSREGCLFRPFQTCAQPWSRDHDPCSGPPTWMEPAALGPGATPAPRGLLPRSSVSAGSQQTGGCSSVPFIVAREDVIAA